MLDLRELKKNFSEPLTIDDEIINNWAELKKFWDLDVGYNLDEYIENEPILLTQEEIEDEYFENSGIDEKLANYLDTEAMVADDYTSGYLRDLEINGVKHYYRTY